MTGYPTLISIKEHLGLDPGFTDDDAYLTATLAAVIDAVEQYCQRIFPLAEETQKDYRIVCLTALHLNRWPVASITSVTKTLGGMETLLSPTEYQFDEVTGSLLFNVCQTGDMVSVYNGGFDPIPPAVEYVINESVKALYTNKDADSTQGPIKSERVDGAATLAYFSPAGYDAGSEGGGSPAPKIISNLANLLDTYRSENVWGAW